MSVDNRVERKSILPRFGEVLDLYIRVSLGLHLRPEEQGVLCAPPLLGILGIDDNVLDLNEFEIPGSKSGIWRRLTQPYRRTVAQYLDSKRTCWIKGGAAKQFLCKATRAGEYKMVHVDCR